MNITAGIYKGRKVKTPKGISRPTLSKIRESVFNTLFSMMHFEGKCFLDVFAGSGIMGLEALSRGFESALAIEKNPKAAKILKENYANIKLELNIRANSKPEFEQQSRVGSNFAPSPLEGEGLGWGALNCTQQHKTENVLNSPRCDLIVGDSLKILPKLSEKFDIIYLDPPYQSGIYEKTLQIIKDHSLLKESGIVILEHNTEICTEGFNVIKEKKYSNKLITFLQIF